MKKIFLLDDDSFVTTLYKARLQHEGFQVDASNDSRAALSKIEEFLPDLLVLDLHMPQVSGVDILRMIRSHSNTRLRTLPVVILSSGHVQDLLDEIGSLGVQRIFVKMQSPPNTLIAGIKEVLSNCSRKNNSLEAAAEATGGSSAASLPGLLDQFALSEDKAELHNLLIEIYKAAWLRIRKGLRDDETTPRGRLSRALQKLIQDLYDHPEHITPSTKETVSKGLNKLAQFDEEVLGSETALKSLLDDLD
jgi:CheY-like chemotaxis protein